MNVLREKLEKLQKEVEKYSGADEEYELNRFLLPLNSMVGINIPSDFFSSLFLKREWNAVEEGRRS